MPKSNDKIVLVVDYECTTGPEDQDVSAIIEALRDRIEDEDAWLQDDDHEDESGVAFTVQHVEVVDADVAEVNLP